MFRLMNFEKTPKSGFGLALRALKRTFGLDIFKGLALTIKEFFKPHVVVLYPMEQLALSPRYRAIHALCKFAESESEKCIGCGLCAKICPSNCIAISTRRGKDSRRIAESYTINFGRCIYCGLCAEVCPELAIIHGSDIENASMVRAQFGDKQALLENAPSVEFSGYGAVEFENLKATPLEFLDAKNTESTTETATDSNTTNADSTSTNADSTKRAQDGK